MNINPHTKLFHVPFTSVKITDAFWKPKIETHRRVTLPVCIKKCEETGRVSNFSKAAGQMDGDFEGLYFNDSDVYKVLEGIAYSLMECPDPEMEATADGIIDKIAAAQQPDGYLNTYYILVKPDKRWTNMSKHETYCAGHLIEAAVAYFDATGKAVLLDVACRLADHLCDLFGEGKRHWVTGHEEVELALIKLYKATGREPYLELARFLVEERGHGYGVGNSWEDEDQGPAYCQDDMPVREMSHVSGHAVRAMYLYSSVADLAALTCDRGYEDALKRIWHSVVDRNMYITGGIGPSNMNEGFTKDYDMPNATSYCETCASVGMVYWNHRMNLLFADARYADILERPMYNGAISGVSLSGNKFFYANPLESDGSRHRREWFECSCCPTQIARFIPSIGNYVYIASDNEIWVNLFINSEADIRMGNGNVRLLQKTDYPWSGRVDIRIDVLNTDLKCIHLRFPGWCRSAMLYFNGSRVEDFKAVNGYIDLESTWQQGDEISLQLDMPVERVYAHPEVKADAGKVAIQRGPVVYCAEETDNKECYEDIHITQDTMFFMEKNEELLGGVVVITAVDRLTGSKAVLVPYYTIDNREPGRLKVWLVETNGPARLYNTSARFGGNGDNAGNAADTCDAAGSNSTQPVNDGRSMPAHRLASY